MHVARDFYQVTIHCPGPCRELFVELREQSREHIIEDIRLEARTGRDIIQLSTDDLDVVRDVLRRRAPKATFVQILEHDRGQAAPGAEPGSGPTGA